METLMSAQRLFQRRELASATSGPVLFEMHTRTCTERSRVHNTHIVLDISISDIPSPKLALSESTVSTYLLMCRPFAYWYSGARVTVLHSTPCEFYQLRSQTMQTPSTGKRYGRVDRADQWAVTGLNSTAF